MQYFYITSIKKLFGGDSELHRSISLMRSSTQLQIIIILTGN